MTRAKVLGGIAISALLAAPAVAQPQGMQQMLGGLLSGNQNQDQAVRDAYERGYQRGRQDEARLGRRPPPPPSDAYGRPPYEPNDQYRR